MNRDNDMDFTVRVPSTLEGVAALKKGDTVASSIGLPRPEIASAIAARSSGGWSETWAGPGMTCWTLCVIDDCAAVGELRKNVIAPRHVAELCDACILTTMPRAMRDDDPLGADRDQDDEGRYVWSHSEYVVYVPHAEAN